MFLFRSMAAAFSMLTWLPFPKSFMPTEKEIRYSSEFFFLPGLFFALCDAVIGAFSASYLPQMAAAAVMTVLPEWESRGFHLDGLADTGDGFLSSRPREKILEIMHDSRIGSMGVLAMVSCLLCKFAFLASVPPNKFWLACAFAAFAGRVGMTLLICLGKYARKEGLAKIMFEHKPVVGMIVSMGLFMAGCHFLAGTWLPLILLLLFIPFWLLLCRNKIGGQTGDTLGAACEILSCLTAAVFLCFDCTVA